MNIGSGWHRVPSLLFFLAPDLNKGCVDTRVYLFLYELGAARNMITAVEQRKLREAQQTERDLAEKVSQATVEHLKHTFAKDMAVLRGRVPNQTQIARDAALDKKYLAERQKSHGHIMHLL